MILITGATGNVGRHVVSQLVERGVEVRALTRDPERAGLPDGVDVVRGDLADPGGLEEHLDVDAVFLVWPFTSYEAAATLAPKVVEALGRHAGRIVYLSAQAAADQPRAFWAVVERLVERSGAAWTMLRPTGFATNTLRWAEQIRAGDVVRWPSGRATRTLIDERDLAAVAVRALTEDGHDGARYVLSGPERLTQIEQVAAIGAALDRSLGWEELSRQEARGPLIEAFGDEAFADAALDGWEAFVDRPEIRTDTVEQVTGAPARTFAEWARDHAGDFGPRVG